MKPEREVFFQNPDYIYLKLLINGLYVSHLVYDYTLSSKKCLTCISGKYMCVCVSVCVYAYIYVVLGFFEF